MVKNSVKTIKNLLVNNNLRAVNFANCASSNGFFLSPKVDGNNVLKVNLTATGDVNIYTKKNTYVRSVSSKEAAMIEFAISQILSARDKMYYKSVDTKNILITFGR